MIKSSSPPFVVLALPRSRTYWISKYLSYGGWHCGHDEARHCRSLDDAKAWLSQPSTGTIETAVAPFWRLLLVLRPDVRIVTVRRPVDDAVASWMRVCPYADQGRIAAAFRKLDARINRIEQCSEVLSVSFEDLKTEAICAKVFEHCLPFSHDHVWWAHLAPINLQTDIAALLRYTIAHQRQIEAVAKSAAATIRYISQRRQETPEPADDGVLIHEESFVDWWRDGQKLLAEHCTSVGLESDAPSRMPLRVWERLVVAGMAQIVTARLNGRMIGYLHAVLSPSVEDEALIATQGAFYVSPDARGLNIAMRMQRAAITRARERGCKRMYFRQGIRGPSVDRLHSFYKRLGARDFGQLYELDLAV